MEDQESHHTKRGQIDMYRHGFEPGHSGYERCGHWDQYHNSDSLK